MEVKDFDVPIRTNVARDQTCSNSLGVVVECNALSNTNDEFAPNEVLSKSNFLEVDERELNNVNIGGCKANKHVKV